MRPRWSISLLLFLFLPSKATILLEGRIHRTRIDVPPKTIANRMVHPDKHRTLLIRGGSSNPYQPFQTSQQQRNLESNLSRRGYQAQHPQQIDSAAFYSTDAPDIPQQEDFIQDRYDTWRAYQTAQSEAMQAAQFDENGRVKLLTSVSQGSRTVCFILFMLRSIHLYEVSHKAFTGSFLRMLASTSMASLFVANLAGVVASLSASLKSRKKRLKAILNLNKLVEVVLLVRSFARLTLFPGNGFLPREKLIVSMFHSVVFLLQSHAITRFAWDENAAPTLESYSNNVAAKVDGSEERWGAEHRSNSIQFISHDRINT